MFDLRLEALHLENFRGFGNLEVTFDPDITIFISENGGGKSTILDATAECLRFFYQYALVRQKYETKFKSTDVKNGLHAASCRLVVNMEYPYTELNKSKTNNTDEVEEEDDRPIHNANCFWELNLNDNGGTEVKYAQGNIADSITIEGYRIATNVLRKKENLPILVYYGRNAFNRPQAAGNAKVKSRIDAVYANALEPERFSFNQLYQWYDEKQRLALQEKDTKIKKFQDDIAALEQELKNIGAQKAKQEGEVTALKLDEEIVTDKIAQLRKNKQTGTVEFKDLTNELKTLKQRIQNAEAAFVESSATFENVKTEQETHKNKLDLVVQGKSLDEELDLLNNAVLDMLNDDDKRYSNFRLDYKSKEFAFDKLTYDNKTETISFSQMSSGEKALFALVADLVRRIIA
ncbi:MAG TPA: AAA family ATPase, partial [Chitinophagales bacterium]|nr:AAA family ATPase [Chitinophagales bacterium]